MFVLVLVDCVDELMWVWFGVFDLCIDIKLDLMLVIDVDWVVEFDVCQMLGCDWFGDGVLGEEFGGLMIFIGWQWIVDLIDGIKNFVCGVLVWVSLIVLFEDGVLLVGVVSVLVL